MRKALSICFLFCLFSRAHGQGTISTVAGSMFDFATAAKSSLATDAPLGTMGQPAVDAAGNVYAADTSNNIVVKITPAGVLTVVAGSGAVSFPTDGIPATQTSLNAPTGVAVDTAGNLFICDTGNNVVRKVDTSGIITLFAGNGSSLFNPVAVAVDSHGNVYIADQGGYLVRKVDTNGIITTFAGNGPNVSALGDGGQARQALVFPLSLAFDAAGNLYIADFNRVRKVNAAGIISTVVGTGNPGFGGDGGAATSALLHKANGVAFDAIGNLLISDSLNGRIRKVTPAGIISSIAGDGNVPPAGVAATETSFQPNSVAADVSGNVYISIANRILKVTPAGTTTFAGTGNYRFAGDNGPATSGWLNRPFGIATDTTGSIFFADSVNSRIRKIAPNGIISTVAGGGRNTPQAGLSATSVYLNKPYWIAVDPSGSLFILDFGSNLIWKVAPDGTLAAGFPAGSGFTVVPYYIATDTAGNLFVSDHSAKVVLKVTPSGAVSVYAGAPATAALGSPDALALDGAGNLYIADDGNYTIRKVDTMGKMTTIAGGGTSLVEGVPATSARLAYSAGIAADASGNLYLADYEGGRLRKVTADGILYTVAGPGKEIVNDGMATNANIGTPGGVVASGGYVYLTDGISRVLKYTDAPFPTFAVSANVLSFSTVSGTNPAPQTVTLSSSASVPWTTVVTMNPSGAWLKVPASGTSPANLVVSIDATMLCANNGLYSGMVAINTPGALPSTVTIQVTLALSLSPNAPVINTMVSAASFKSGTTRGSLVSVFGTNLSSATVSSDGLPWPTKLNGTSLMIGGKLAPLVFVSPGQINAQVPWDAPSGQVILGVTSNGALGCKSAVDTSITGLSPAIFATNSAGQGAILSANTALLAAPAGPGARPATAGDYLSIFATGLGAVSNTPANGAPALGAPALTNSQPDVTIGGIHAPVTFSGLAPGFVGLYQVNVQVPAGVTKGNAVPVVLYSNSNLPSNTVTIAVQ